MPGGSDRPSEAPCRTVSEPVSLVKPCAPSLVSIRRKYSMPPLGFLPLPDTMNGSLAPAYPYGVMPAALILSRVAVKSSQVVGGVQPLLAHSLALYQMP